MRWTLKAKPNSEKIIKLQEALQVDSLVATLLVQRGIETYEEAKHFFRPSLNDLHDPFLMKDMDKAVNRIEKALKNGENILVYGDYDVDGTTSVALMSSYLKTKTPNIDRELPWDLPDLLPRVVEMRVWSILWRLEPATSDPN